MRATDAQYMRYQRIAGGIICTDLQLIKVAYSRFSSVGKLYQYKEQRKSFYKSLLEKHHINWY